MFDTLGYDCACRDESTPAKSRLNNNDIIRRLRAAETRPKIIVLHKIKSQIDGGVESLHCYSNHHKMMRCTPYGDASSVMRMMCDVCADVRAYKRGEVSLARVFEFVVVEGVTSVVPQSVNFAALIT